MWCGLQLIVNARGLQKHIGYVDAQLAVIDFEARWQIY